MGKIRVELGRRGYDIVTGSGSLGDIGGALGETGSGGKVAVVSNPTVFGLYGDTVVGSLKKSGFEPVVVTVPDGEEHKSLLWVEHIVTEMLKAKLDRSSSVLALGGGVVGDMAGFAASVFMRGVRYVQVPTTLLAQVDSSVGGKTGVNHPLGKNLIGAFWQPLLVWVDVETLKTLPEREFLAGMAEVIKYGVIRDEDLFDLICRNAGGIRGLDPALLKDIIEKSCAIKAEVVAEDEREGGLRAILNYGHTVGHAIESVAGYGRLLHGEAVAVGMVLEARLSAEMGVLEHGAVDRIEELVSNYGLPVALPEGVVGSALVDAMELDKKSLGGELRFVLPERVGSVKYDVSVDRGLLGKVLGA